MKRHEDIEIDINSVRETCAILRRTMREGSELAIMAGRVVAKRVALGAAAMIDPAHADHAEFSRMIPEKTAAFHAAAMILLAGSGRVTEQMSSFVIDEIATATRAAMAMATWPHPNALIGTTLSMAWFDRIVGQSIALGQMALRAQAAAMAPVHRTATENAQRLGT